MRPILLPFIALGLATTLHAQSSRLDAEVDRRAAQVEGKVVAWRRDIHEHPELSNRETRTAELVAQHLRSLGLEVRTGVAHTGVVGVLRGGKPGPVVALRADMDALPVTEEVDVPFASKVRTTYNGQEVGVMHACGHDTHTAMLMGVAEVLAGMRNDLAGTVKFIFQPAEEGAPAGERGGAALMIEEGALDDPKPSAIFGLHVFPYPAGEIRYRPGGTMASADAFRIVVRGRQTHGALPWAGIDPIVIASQIVLGLQTIASRQVDPLQHHSGQRGDDRDDSHLRYRRPQRHPPTRAPHRGIDRAERRRDCPGRDRYYDGGDLQRSGVDRANSSNVA
jgi:amidohydrolase